MPLLSSSLLLRTHALTLLLCSYYLLTSPSTLLSCTPIWLLGESMSIRPAGYSPENLPIEPTYSSPKGGFKLNTFVTRGGGDDARELFALLAVMAVVYAGMMFLFAGDLTVVAPSSSSDGEGRAEAKSSSRYAEELHTLLTAQSRWLTLSGLHVLGASMMVGWIYMFHSHDKALSSAESFASQGNSFLTAFNLLPNRVTFSAALMDMLFWGYLWTVLKDEGREVGKALARRREIEDEAEE